LGHEDVTGSCSNYGRWGNSLFNNDVASPQQVWHVKNGCYGNNRGGFYQDFTSKPGATYEVSFAHLDGWFHAKSSKSGIVHLEVQSPLETTVMDRAHESFSGALKSDASAGLWDHVGPWRFTAKGAVSRIYFYAGGSSCANIDNVKVTETTAIPNLLENGDFEEDGGWTSLCPPGEKYLGHEDVTGSCSNYGRWGNSLFNNDVASPQQVWHVKNGCYGNNRGGFYQDFTSKPGATYEVSFAHLDGWFHAKSSKSGIVHLEVQSPLETTVMDRAHESFSGALKSDASAGLWDHVGPWRFTAKGAVSRIYFYAGGSSCANIDNVAVMEVNPR